MNLHRLSASGANTFGFFLKRYDQSAIMLHLTERDIGRKGRQSMFPGADIWRKEVPLGQPLGRRLRIATEDYVYPATLALDR